MAYSESGTMKFATKAIHIGHDPAQHNRAVMPPIYQTSVFAFDTIGEDLPFAYGRSGTPTRSALEQCIAALENAKYGLAFASGMAAIDAVLRATLKPGDEVIAVADLYGGAYRLLTRVMQPLGVAVRFVDLTNPAALTEQLSPATKLLWLESPTNPLLNLVDIENLAKIAHAANVKVAVDNTFATPYLQNPLELGADVVVHSATKYLGGHSDAMHGLVALNDDALHKDIRFILNAAGAVPGPQDSFLVLRGIKTLALRMERHCDNAERAAAWLQTQPAVEKVFYPGLPEHPAHQLARRQQRRFGGIVSIYLKDDRREAAARVVEKLKLFTLAESLGGVESLINHSASMSHASLPPSRRAELGIREGLLRLSLGVEDIDDLLEDLAQALA
jgi:cystathionine beta-lyase/cystathionine gamma-synthase